MDTATASSSIKTETEPNCDEEVAWQKLIGLKSGRENDFWIAIECNGIEVLSTTELFKPNCYFCNINFPIDENSRSHCNSAESESCDADLVIRFNSTKKKLFAKLKCEADSCKCKTYRCPQGEHLKKGDEVEILSLNDLFETLKSQNGNIDVDPRDLKLLYVNGRRVNIGIKSRAAASLFVSLAHRPFSGKHLKIF